MLLLLLGRRRTVSMTVLLLGLENAELAVRSPKATAIAQSRLLPECFAFRGKKELLDGAPSSARRSRPIGGFSQSNSHQSIEAVAKRPAISPLRLLPNIGRSVGPCARRFRNRIAEMRKRRRQATTLRGS